MKYLASVVVIMISLCFVDNGLWATSTRSFEPNVASGEGFTTTEQESSVLTISGTIETVAAINAAISMPMEISELSDLNTRIPIHLRLSFIGVAL